MKKHKVNIDGLINEDLTSLIGKLRVFHDNNALSVDEVTRDIIKYFPSSIVLKSKALKEFGKTAILLGIEQQISQFNKTSRNIEASPVLTGQLKSHLNNSGKEIQGDILSSREHAQYFSLTLNRFCSQIMENQRIVLCLEFNNNDFFNEFMEFAGLFVENLPNKLVIYIFINNNNLSANTFNYDPNFDYYWSHPTELGNNLYFLLKNSSSSLIEHLTSNEISLLLRLWNLNDVAIPVIESALQFISNYSVNNLELIGGVERFSVTLNNTDRFEAEGKLYRELAFHYFSIAGLETSNAYREKALDVVEKSAISSSAKIKFKGLLWGDYAQIAKESFDFIDTLRALTTQKSLYETDKENFIKELALVAHNLGVCYRLAGEYRKAIDELLFSLDIVKKSRDLEAEVETLLEIGKVYIDIGDHDSALFQFESIKKLLSHPYSNRSEYIQGIVLAYISTIKKALGENETAYVTAKEAISTFSRIGNKKDIEKLLEIFKDISSNF